MQLGLRRRPGLRRLAPLAAILAVWLLFFWRLFTPVEADRVQLEPGDFTLQFLVFRQFGLSELEHGRWPLWMPCVDSGYPYFADPQSASFYPPVLVNWGFHLLSGAHDFSIHALELEAALHVLFAALTAYGFLRGQTKARTAALIGALAFAFGGYLTGYPILQLAILETAAWLPLILWVVRRLAQQGDVRSAALAALPLAMSLLAGHPQTFAIILYLVIAYFVYQSWQRRMRAVRALVLLAVMFGVTIAISAIQLWPSLEFTRLSSRAEISYDTAGMGFPLSDVVQLLVAGAVSRYSPLYVGVVPLVLAVFAIGALISHRTARSEVQGACGDRLFWLIVAAAGLLISFGGHVALFDALYWFAPGFRLFRDQERNALLFSWAVGALAAYGADDVLHHLPRRLRSWLQRELRWLMFLSAIAGLATFVLVYLRSQGTSSNWPDQVALTFGLLMAAVATLSFRTRGQVRGLAIGLTVVVALELATNDRAVNWVAPYDPFPAQPPLTAIQADAPADAVFRLHNEQRLPGHAACAAGLSEVGGITPIHIDSYDRFIKTVPREVRWQLLNVRYVVTWRSALDGHLGQPIESALLRQDGDGKDAVYTYRLADVGPRAWIVHEVIAKPSRAAILDALGEPGFSAHQLAYTQFSVEAVTNQATEPVTIRALDPNHVAVEAELVTPGLLVVSEVNYPGWAATANGHDAPIIEVDGVLRGVALPAGHWLVDMTFMPASWLIGRAMTAIGTSITLGYVIAIGQRRRRQRVDLTSN